MEHSINILVIAPHPDDDILGCGGTIAKFSQTGANVYVAIMTSGNVGAPELFPIEGTERGRREALESHKKLFVKETFFYDFPAPRLETHPSYKISIELDKLIRKLNADTILIPHRGDIHKDHRVIFEASIVAARPVNNCPVKRIFAYETLSETEWAAPFSDDAFIPTVFVVLTEEEYQMKLDAFNCYTEPRKKVFPHSRSVEGIENLATYRGIAVQKNYAEAYMLIREVI